MRLLRIIIVIKSHGASILRQHVKTMEMNAIIQYILTSAYSFGSQDHNKSLMTVLGLASVLLQKSADIDKMENCLFRRKHLLGCLGELEEVSKQQQIKE